MPLLRRLSPVLLAAVALSLAACGEKSDVVAPPAPQSLSIALDRAPSADHAGLYRSLTDGEFRRAGLLVTPRVPSDPAAPLKQLQAGKVDLAIASEPDLLLARDEGVDLVAIGAIIQRPLTSLIAIPPSKVKTAEDLAGAKVGTSGLPLQRALLTSVLRSAGVASSKVDVSDVGSDLVGAMTGKKVDATLGGFWNVEGIELKVAKKDPRIVRVDQAGVPTYAELVVVARRKDAGRRGGLLRRFMIALARGTAAAKADPGAAADALLKANGKLKRPVLEASIEATLPVFTPADADTPFGYQDARTWDTFGNWMFDSDLVKTNPNASRAFTNEFLPGEGLSKSPTPD